MEVEVLMKDYKGVDGTSLSSSRCAQIIRVYEMLEELGAKVITYIDIQEESVKRHLLGTTKDSSAIRTIFPLLKKIGFVNYEGMFPAKSCFTELGTQFVLACRALNNISDETPHKEEIMSRLRAIKQKIQCQGLIHMFNDPEYQNHNIWVALKLLKEFSTIHWNEFIYTLTRLGHDETVEDAISYIKSHREKVYSMTFVKPDGSPLSSTCYSYIRSYLEEAGLIRKISTMESSLTEDAKIFYSQIDL